MKAAKQYTLEITRPNGRVNTVTGDLEYLRDYFSYTLQIGHSYKKSIKEDGGSTITSFVKNLQNAFGEKEANLYQKTYVHLM